ncbi:unnamed protein product [Meloidogyne enterolobii]|uniref:Uncharacterized protein n=1 Tax=Meloidogyne enterolobii TaxID=390850 RepID=A0ACB0ZE84_MELEN
MPILFSRTRTSYTGTNTNFEQASKHYLYVSLLIYFFYLEDFDYEEYYLLKFSNFQKNINDIIFARYFLEQLFNCTFEYALFYDIIFNPEMINILFDNDKTIPLQFNVQDARIWPNNESFETVLKFYLNHLSISGSFTINLGNVDITEQQTNILLNILINEGNKLPQIDFKGLNITKLYDPIINYITTSRDCPITVPVILLNFTTSLHFKLCEKAGNVEVKKLGNVRYINYQIANIYNPKVRFAFSNSEDNDGLTFGVKIRKMKE